jgi:hypothetical protein
VLCVLLYCYYFALAIFAAKQNSKARKACTQQNNCFAVLLITLIYCFALLLFCMLFYAVLLLCYCAALLFVFLQS